MKSCHIFFVLFAVAAGEALPPNAVPVMCAAICGPIVELSSMCSPKRSLEGSENHRLDLRERLGQDKRRNGKPFDESDEIEERFSVIVLTPTKLPLELPVEQHSPTSTSLSERSILSILELPSPTPILTITADYLPPPTDSPTSQSPTTSTTRSFKPTSTKTKTITEKSFFTTSKHQTTIRPTIIGSTGDGSDMTGGWSEPENAEEKCVCSNTSFNVSDIAGLCASCISMMADTQNNMEVIMSVCNFPPQQYSPDKDKLASNILVKATRPTAVAKSDGASQRIGSLCVGTIFGTASITIAALTML